MKCSGFRKQGNLSDLHLKMRYEKRVWFAYAALDIQWINCHFLSGANSGVFAAWLTSWSRLPLSAAASVSHGRLPPAIMASAGAEQSPQAISTPHCKISGNKGKGTDESFRPFLWYFVFFVLFAYITWITKLPVFSVACSRFWRMARISKTVMPTVSWELSSF